MSAVTVDELIKVSGITEKELEYIFKRFNEYLPFPLAGGLSRTSIIPSEDAPYIIKISAMLKTNKFDENEIIKLLGNNIEKKENKKNIDTRIMKRLDEIAKGYEILKKQYEKISENNSILIKKNSEMKKVIENIGRENTKMKQLLGEKKDENKLLGKKITQLASVVLKLKRENNELQHIMIELERRLEKNNSNTNMQNIERRFEKFENAHSRLENTLASINTSIIKKNSVSFFEKMKNWFAETSFENNYNL